MNVVSYIKSSNYAKYNCVFFKNLHENDWARSTSKMLEKSRYDYLYIFLEDHFLLKSISHFKSVIRDMIRSGIEYFSYSFFNIGLSINNSEILNPDYSKHFYSFKFGENIIARLRKTNKDFYPFSLACVCTKQYFKNLLNIENKILIKVPFLLQVVMENILFMYPRNRQFWATINRAISPLKIKFVIYTPASPFNLERSLFDIEKELLPIRVGGLKEELFANWDDDNKLSNSSLIKRGLYPKKFVVENVKRYSNFSVTKTHSMKKGSTEQKQYYPNIYRILSVPKKRIVVVEGIMRLCARKESYVLKENEGIVIYSNIPHSIVAIRDLIYSSEIL